MIRKNYWNNSSSVSEVFRRSWGLFGTSKKVFGIEKSIDIFMQEDTFGKHSGGVQDDKKRIREAFGTIKNAFGMIREASGTIKNAFGMIREAFGTIKTHSG